MTDLRDCTEEATWWPHVSEATRALAAGGLVVMPTDTVYGIAADAFQPDAVQALLDAKGRGRDMPPPVLIGDIRTLDGLADAVPEAARELATKFWPGPLTIILQAQPSLQWDLGETQGTVALRMPDHPLTLAVLQRTGPLAVSSANTSGSPAATTAAEAASMLGTSVRVYLDGGTSPGGVASTIVDATGETLRIVREGALSAEDLGLVGTAPNEDVSEAVADSAAAAKPVRKPRSRKPAATAAAGEQKEAEEKSTGEAPEAAAEDATAVEKPARKPRSRKPATAAGEQKVAEEQPTGEAPEDATAVEKPARKPRSRKPAATAGEQAPAEVTATDEATATEDATAVERPARKPRSRKPAAAKTPPAEKAPTPTEPVDAPPEAPEP